MLIGSLSGILAPLAIVQRLLKNHKKDKDFETAKLIHMVKEEVSQVDKRLTREVLALEEAMEIMRSGFAKDLEHTKESHETKLESLSEKIEQLREEVRSQHSQLIALLTKLISN